MITVECRLPVKYIPAIKKTCRELGVEMITAEQDGESLVCYFMVFDYGTLVSIGWISGVDSYYASIASPLKGIVEEFEQKIEKVKNNENRKD